MRSKDIGELIDAVSKVYCAHTVRVDPDGNIWVVDVGGHLVVKMNPRGRVLMQLGRRGVPGTGHANFNLPTDVAFAPNGDFYVTDGYGNSRVVKYSREGNYLLEWGTKGSGPGEFMLPHAVVLDARGRVYVADRETRRIEIFDSAGKFLSQWKDIGGFSGLAMTKEQQIVIASRCGFCRPRLGCAGVSTYRRHTSSCPDMMLGKRCAT